MCHNSRVHSPQSIWWRLWNWEGKVSCNLSQFVQGEATSANTVHSYASQRGGSFELNSQLFFKSLARCKSNTKNVFKLKPHIKVRSQDFSDLENAPSFEKGLK